MAEAASKFVLLQDDDIRFRRRKRARERVSFVGYSTITRSKVIIVDMVRKLSVSKTFGVGIRAAAINISSTDNNKRTR